MATLQDSITRQNCASSALGTGSKWCDFNPEDIAHAVFTPKDVKIPLTETFNLAYFESLQLAGKAVLLKNSVSFEDNTEDNVEQTYNSGKTQIARKGLPKYSLTFTDGIGKYKAMQSLDSRNALRVFLVDSANNWMVVNENDTYIKGLLTTFVGSEAAKFSTGAEVTSKMIKFQIASRQEFDFDIDYIPNEKSEFNISEADGINELVYSFKTNPANSDTAIVVNVYSMVNRNIDVAELMDGETTSIQLNVNGTDSVPTAVVRTGANEVTMTVAAVSTSDVVFLKANPFSLTDVGLFKASDSKSVVVG